MRCRKDDEETKGRVWCVFAMRRRRRRGRRSKEVAAGRKLQRGKRVSECVACVCVGPMELSGVCVCVRWRSETE